MSLSREALQRAAADGGFRVEILEKVDRLLDLLQAVRQHPYLASRVALKGGTALNLFVFDVPRLSVDIDFNFIGTETREDTLAERPRVEAAVRAVAHRLDLAVERAASAHAGGKWRLRYASVLGQGGTLELDINYMYRLPLWPVSAMESRPVGPRSVREIPVLDLHELAAGKLAALLSRHAARDLFDAHRLLTRAALDPYRLRVAFMLCGAMNPRDWREVRVEDVRADPAELRRQLLPVLAASAAPGAADLARWTDRLVTETRAALSLLLPMTALEDEFLTRLHEQGEIRPELLRLDARLAGIVARHPALLWKAKQARDGVP